MDRSRPRLASSRPVALIEPLEDRRLLSAVVVAPPPPSMHVIATPAAHVVAQASASRTSTVRPFDDEDGGGDDSSGDSGGESSGGSTDAGSDNGTSSDDGGEAGGSTDTTGSSDAGESAGSGDAGSSGGGSGGGDSGTPSPVDDNPTDNGSGTTNQDNGGGGGVSTDDGSEDGILYPTGDPYDDSLYDDGGGTTLILYPAPYAANFGGSLKVKLPADPVIGDSGVATVNVFNTGGRANGNIELALGVTADGSAADATRVADRTVPIRLGHDRVTTYKVPFTLPATLAPGRYQFLALIDAGNAFTESDESDNVAIGPTVTLAPATTDVAVTSANTRAAVKAGKAVPVAVHVRSMGSIAEAGTTTVTVTATPTDGSSGPVELATVDRNVHLHRGQAGTLKLSVPSSSLPAGEYLLTVTATPVSASDANLGDKSAVTHVLTLR